MAHGERPRGQGLDKPKRAVEKCNPVDRIGLVDLRHKRAELMEIGGVGRYVEDIAGTSGDKDRGFGSPTSVRFNDAAKVRQIRSER